MLQDLLFFDHHNKVNFFRKISRLYDFRKSFEIAILLNSVHHFGIFFRNVLNVTENRVKLNLELGALLFILYENHLGCATRVYGNPVVIQ